jgi:hypothetical protein
MVRAPPAELAQLIPELHEFPDLFFPATDPPYHSISSYLAGEDKSEKKCSRHYRIKHLMI